jgi:hypothetical protein
MSKGIWSDARRMYKFCQSSYVATNIRPDARSWRRRVTEISQGRSFSRSAPEFPAVIPPVRCINLTESTSFEGGIDCIVLVIS